MADPAKRKSSARILLVDDNDLGLMVRRVLLADAGHEIVTSRDPQAALVICRQQNFDVVVTDYKMPGMTGLQFIQMLRDVCPGLPVILLSGFTDTLGLTEKNTGADAVIQKSSNEIGHLDRAIHRILNPPKKPVGKQGKPARPKKQAK